MLARVAVAVRSQASVTRGVSSAAVRAAAQAMLRALRLEDAELSIVLCDDRHMRALNRRHRGKDRTTDVLAFALHEGRPLLGADARMLGDVVISLPTAARQARAARKNTADEVRMLLAHGLLHLLGDDHQTRAAERRMTARTDVLRAAAAAQPRTSWGGTRPAPGGSRRPVGFSSLADRRIRPIPARAQRKPR